MLRETTRLDFDAYYILATGHNAIWRVDFRLNDDFLVYSAKDIRADCALDAIYIARRRMTLQEV